MVASLASQMLPDAPGSKESSVVAETTAPDHRSDLEEFYSVVTRWFKTRHMDMPPALGILRSRSSNTYRELADANVRFRSWLWSALGERPNKAERMSFLYFALDLLGEYMTRSDVAMSLPVIARNLDKTPGLIEAQFPGYIRAGLLRLIVTRQADSESA